MDNQNNPNSNRGCMCGSLHDPIPHGSDSVAQSTRTILASVHTPSEAQTRSKALAVASRYLRHDSTPSPTSATSATDLLQWLLQTAAVNPSDCVPDIASQDATLLKLPVDTLNAHVASSSITTSARNAGDSEGSSASSSASTSPSSSSSPSSGRPGSPSRSSSSAYVGAGSSTSAFLYSTSQEFGQIWTQTTAFLHRTFSPTYRVGNLYLESWTNGTQKRGLERLRTSMLRGDAFLLVRNMTVQLQSVVARNITESREMERHVKKIENEKRRGGQGQAQGNGHEKGKGSSGMDRSDSSSDGNNNAGAGDGEPRNS
ncbi:hypothetical protein BGZ99_004063 [Dissophora globulifera]|uniref:Uncharacterized protein n=1 Tax=Dissophora globulifera TaxID=979702 RepID=A0A9P6UVM0_9FUNG|nr:hypothetical protein BGZ99_004063 [Dissophora globulifera]